MSIFPISIHLDYYGKFYNSSILPFMWYVQLFNYFKVQNLYHQIHILYHQFHILQAILVQKKSHVSNMDDLKLKP